MPPETSVTSDPATAVSQRENSTVATETPEQKTDDMDSTATPEESRDAGNAVIEDRTTATLQADEDSPITKVEEKPEENDTAAAADTVQTSSQTPKDNPSNPKNPPNAEPIVPVEDTIEVSTIASRPKRRSTKLINYKEKQESDIPSLRMDSKRTTKLRRTKSSTSESTSPPPGANSSLPSSSASKTVSYFDVDDVVPLNYQPPVSPDSNFNELIDIRNAKIDSTETVLTLKNGYTIKKGDCIYMICEPATEPFYIAQILGFTKKDKNSTYKKASNYMFSVCWFYRPRDLNRRLTDSRLVYASLHRDNCPLTSFRGFVTVKHKSEIEDLDTYKQQPDCFYFDKLYDRYMIKMYDMIPTVKLLHLPPNYYKALNKRFEYIFVEVGKADELLSSPKNCEKCLQWCSNSDSILCSGCQKSYHLLCLDPPILSKPKRGFAWYCAACNKELEDKLAENRGKMLESSLPSQIIKAEELASQDTDISDSTDQNPCSNGVMSNTDDNNSTDIPSSLRYEQLAEKFLEDDKNVSFKKRRALEEWPYRYLGVHAKFEDALDLQDRPYARAASRLGSKYQCTSVCDWFDHTVQYYDANESSSNSNNRKLKKYYNRSKKSQTPLLVEEDELENKKFPVPEPYKDKKPKDFPGWLQPRPKGYIERGGDDTSTLLWKMPVSATSTEKELGDMVEQYIKDCSGVAKRLKLTTVTTPNFVDAILLILMRHNYKADDCMEDVNKLTRESLKEPTFTEEEVKRFEDSVRIHGSELYPVFKDVKTQTSAMVVRFYYLWKKTKNGHEIWDNFSGRAKNRLKTTKNVGVDLDNPEDDGAYSSGKINRSQVKFRCMYCDTNHSAEWYRAPGAVNDEKNSSCEGLCYRCAKLWRKYAAKWENPMDLIKNQEKKGSSSSRKKIEYALFEEAELVLKAREQYKLHPRKVSEGLTEYKTIDTDTDYINFGKEKPKEKNKKRSTKKQTKNPAPSTSNTSPSTSSARNSTSDVMSENKVKLKKEKKQAATSGSVARKAKRTAKDVEMEVSSEVKKENKDLDSDKPKKRKYKKRKPVDRNLKFVYGKVVDDSSNGSKKLTTKRKECEEANSTESGDLNRYEGLREELMEAKAQLEENNQSGLFNAFLDMKLRERIELLEKECSSLIPEDHVADSSESNLTFVSTSPSSTRPGTKDSTDHSDSSSKKYVRRRLYLSKTSVPGSGVFETPPIQLPSDSPATATSNNGSTLRNKFVFQMYDQIPNMGELNYNISNSEFQSQPLLLPSGISQIESLANVDQSKLGTDSNGTPKESSSSIHASVPSSANTPIMAISSRPNTSREAATIRTGKNNGSQGFFNVSFKGKEYLNLSPSFKVKMLSPLIDYNDKITKDMISRYTSKFDVFNPLLSDDFYISPIYQMRPSSKELHTLWKQYQTSRKSKGRANKAFQPLFPADKRPCCVCRELGDTNQMLICSNCGLNVHASCYGVKLSLKMEKKPGEYNWHCDPCSNDLHPLVSTQYLCMLCNSRESNMDQAIKGDPVSIPDALKRTAEGRWCHVTCSLFSDNIKYGTDSLQPISGTHVTGITNVFQTCDVCLNNGGSIASCEFCPKKAHVTCGLDYGWKLGFKMLQICETTDGDVIEIKDKKLLGKLKPIIYCYDHTVIPELSEQSRILHVSEFGRKLNSKEKGYKTLLELYFSDERKKTENLTSGELRRKVYDDMRGAFDELAKKAHVHSGSSMVQEQNWNHKCSKCSRTSSLLWHNVTSENDVVCHVCFMDQESKVAVPDLSSVNTQKFDYSLYGC